MRACRTPPGCPIDAPWGDAGWRNVVTRTPVGSKCRIEIRERSSRRGLYPGTARAHTMLYDSRDRRCPLMAADRILPSDAPSTCCRHLLGADRVQRTPDFDNLRVGLDQGNLRAARTSRTSASATTIRSGPHGAAPIVPTFVAHPPARYTLSGQPRAGLIQTSESAAPRRSGLCSSRPNEVSGPRCRLRPGSSRPAPT